MTSDSQLGPMLTVREAAALLHVHTNTLRRWTDKGYIRAYRIGLRGDRRFRQVDIAYVAAELKTHHGNEKEAILALQ